MTKVPPPRQISDFKVKVLVGYHEQGVLLKDAVLTPINAGRALLGEGNANAEWLKANTIGDDTGDNISVKNKTYNEMTAIYWAWKNQNKLENPDAIGFWHYRRHLSLNESLRPQGGAWVVEFPGYVGGVDKYFQRIGYTPEALTALAAQYPCIVGSYEDRVSVYDQYKASERDQAHHIEDLEFVRDYVSQKFPEYKRAVSTYLAGRTQFFGNVFVLRKSLFDRYCSFIFNVLQAYEEQLATELRSAWECRFFVSERLTGIFVTKLIEEGIAVKKLAVTFVETTKEYVAPLPDNEAVNLAFATDENYLRYLAVAVSSAARHVSADRKYNAYVMHAGVSAEKQRELLSAVTLPSNFRLSFLDIRPLWNELNVKELVVGAHISVSTYYRFLIQEAFSGFDRVLYLDSDLVILDDVAKLYDIDLKEKPLGAALDIRENFATKKKQVVDNRSWAEYLEKDLGIKSFGQYFQAGVMIFDLQAMQRRGCSLLERSLTRLRKIGNPWLYDQCVLNAEFANEVTNFDVAWNIEWQIGFEFPYYKKELPKLLAGLYFPALDHPKIIHYASPVKPWKNIGMPLAMQWWAEARHTGYYETMLQDCWMSAATLVAVRKKMRSWKEKIKRRWHKIFG